MRTQSGIHARNPEMSTDDRLYLVRSNPARWGHSTIATAPALPLSHRRGAERWERLFDNVERALRPLV
jgi:hypothetical protein